MRVRQPVSQRTGQHFHRATHRKRSLDLASQYQLSRVHYISGAADKQLFLIPQSLLKARVRRFIPLGFGTFDIEVIESI